MRIKIRRRFLLPAACAAIVLLGARVEPSPARQPAPPAVSIARARSIARSAPGTRLVVRGTLTRQRPGVSLFVADVSGSLYASTEQQGPVLQPGDLVEIRGTAANDGFAPSLKDAVYQKIGTGSPVGAVDVSAEELASGSREAQLVRIEARVEDARFGRYENGLLLRAGSSEFLAWVLRESPGASLKPPSGARVRVTGVCSMIVTAGRPTGFELLLRDGGDVIVLSRPVWWTSERLLILVGVIGAALAAAFGWVALLRREVRAQIKARERLEDDLLHAHKLEAIGRLAGGIAHDFNNLLTVVIGYSEVIAAEARDNADIGAAVKEIQAAADRATSLTRQLLAFGRRQMLAAAVVDMNEVVSHMARLLGRVLGGEIEIVTSLDRQPVNIVVDRVQMEQAILNLGMNASHAMDSVGRLTLTTTRWQVSPAAPRGDLLPGEYGVLTISDTGAGMTAEVLEHLFEPFFTTKEVGEGSGMGLAMVYGFVKQSSGHIEVRSTPGAGATFELALPSAETQGAGAPLPGDTAVTRG